MAEAIVLTNRQVPDFLSEEWPEGRFREGGNDRILLDRNGRIRFSGVLIHEKVVVAPGDFGEIIEAFYIQEFWSPIRKIPANTHVRSSQQSKRNIL